MSTSNYNGNYNGNGMSVVIIDSGASAQFANSNVVYSYDFADNDTNTYSREHHHGGAVASVAQSVAGGINIIHLKVFSDGSDAAYQSDIEEGLQ